MLDLLKFVNSGGKILCYLFVWIPVLSICMDPCTVNLQTFFFFFNVCLSTVGTQTQNINQRTSNPASRIPWVKRQVFSGSAPEGWRTFPCTTGHFWWLNSLCHMGGLGFTCSQCNNHLLGSWNSQWQVDAAGDFYGTLLFYFITRKGFYFPFLPHHLHKVFTRNESLSRGGWVCSVCLLKGSAANVCMILSLIRRKKRKKK